MKPVQFRYERARDGAEAVSLLAEHGAEARILAGGQSLIPLVNMRLVRPSLLVDINRIAELDYIRAEDGHLAIGAVARDRDVELSAEARHRCPLLMEALDQVGHVEIRNRAPCAAASPMPTPPPSCLWSPWRWRPSCWPKAFGVRGPSPQRISSARSSRRRWPTTSS